MSEECPSGRLSQIFDSLSCFSDLQKQQQQQQQQQQQHHQLHQFQQRLISEHSQQKPSQNSLQYSKRDSYPSHVHPGGHQTFPPTSSQNQLFGLSASASSSPAMQRRLPPSSAGVQSTANSTPTVQAARLTSTAVIGGSSRSTPNSPRLMPRRLHRAPPIPARPNAALIASPALVALDADAPWPHFSSLTDHLDVHQVNNYTQALPEINWQERCLELQLELHRSKNQAGRIRDMLREKKDKSNFEDKF